MSFWRKAFQLAGLLSLYVFSSLVLAQGYPAKPVRIIVPYPGGGIVDLAARALADGLGKIWGATVIVEPMPGASSMIGTRTAANAEADGYTMLLASTSHTVNPSLFKNVPYDPLKDFVGVVHVANVPNVVTVPSTLPVQSMREFIDYAKVRLGRLNYGHPGIGSTGHLSAELLKRVTEIDLVAVAYKGQPQVIPEMLTGTISIMYSTPPLVVPHIKSGRLKALAVTSDARIEQLPDVPTLEEAGFKETLVSPWFGLVTRAGTPNEIIELVNRDANEALKSPEVIDRLKKIYGVPAGGTAESFNQFLRQEVARWGKLVKETGIQPQ